jgi:hypothetical protein
MRPPTNGYRIIWTTLQSLQRVSRFRESQLPDQVVRSQPNLTIVSTQSYGKYEVHSRIFSIERTPSTLIVRVAKSDRCTCGTAKIGARGEVSKFIILLPHAARV